MITARLFGITREMAHLISADLSHVEFLRMGIILMNKSQVARIHTCYGEEFKYRARAINNYMKWLKDNGYSYEKRRITNRDTI